MNRRSAWIAAPACLAFVALSVALASAAAGGNKSDGLAGRWTWVGFEQAGIAAGPDQLKGWVMTVKNDHLALVGPSRAKIEADLTLAPLNKPKGIDLAFYTEGNRAKPVWGIYEINGETLRICVPRAGAKGRPIDFTATSANGSTLYVFSRKKF